MLITQFKVIYRNKPSMTWVALVQEKMKTTDCVRQLVNFEVFQPHDIQSEFIPNPEFQIVNFNIPITTIEEASINVYYRFQRNHT